MIQVENSHTQICALTDDLIHSKHIEVHASVMHFNIFYINSKNGKKTFVKYTATSSNVHS